MLPDRVLNPGPLTDESGALPTALRGPANRTLIKMLSKYAEENHRMWDDHLPLVLLAYNSSVHDSTSLSPAMTTYARDLDLPADLIFEGPEHASKQASPPPECAEPCGANGKSP